MTRLARKRELLLSWQESLTNFEDSEAATAYGIGYGVTWRETLNGEETVSSQTSIALCYSRITSNDGATLVLPCCDDLELRELPLYYETLRQ